MQMCIVEKAVDVTSITQAAIRPISMRLSAELFLAATIGVLPFPVSPWTLKSFLSFGYFGFRFVQAPPLYTFLPAPYKTFSAMATSAQCYHRLITRADHFRFEFDVIKRHIL